jgi:N-acetylneuraminate synthase
MNDRPSIRIGDRRVGDGEPVYIIAEIGINHNGSLELAEKMIAGAARAGCDAVKFQKRTPELCVPHDQWAKVRETPWGPMSYIEYRRRIEFGANEFESIDRICRDVGIQWFASCWDEPSVDFMACFDPPLFKAASASLTDLSLLAKMKAKGKPLMISTGMSTLAEMDAAVSCLGSDNLLIAHSTSAYPCPLENLNLQVLPFLREHYPQAVLGYSGHEPGLAPTGAAVALGARFIERHITLDRAMWGSDQSASVEMHGLEILVRNVRDIETALGDGVKRVYESEMPARTRLRRVIPHVPPPVPVGTTNIQFSDNI